MAYTGGDIAEIGFNHPEVGSGTLDPQTAQDNEYDFGGVRTIDDENMVTSKGEAIYVMNNKRWKVTAVVVDDMVVRKQLEKMVAMSGSIPEADWTFLHINGTVYRGKGKIVGDLKLNTNQSTFTLTISGGSILAQ